MTDIVDLRLCNAGLVAFEVAGAIVGCRVLFSGFTGAGDAGMVLSLFLIISALGTPPADEAVGRIPLGVLCILVGRELLVVDLNTDFVGLMVPVRPDAAPCSIFVAEFGLSALEICMAFFTSPLS